MTPVVAWLTSLMVTLAPPERLASQPQFAGWEETAEQKHARYESIAEDLYRTVYDPEVRPLFRGKDGRAHTASLLLALAFMESGFAHDVDKGPCVATKGRYGIRCDGGRTACLMQIQLGNGTTYQGWTQADLFADRTKCFRTGLELVRRSLRACRNEPDDYRLNAYASGACGRGHAASRARVAMARRVWAMAPSPGPDVAFVLPSGKASGGTERLVLGAEAR